MNYGKVSLVVLACCFLSSGVAEARKRHHHARHKHITHHVSHLDQHVYRDYHRYDRDTPSPYDYRPEDQFLLPKDAVPYLEVNISEQVDQIRMPYETLVNYLVSDYQDELVRIASQEEVRQAYPLGTRAAIGLVLFSGMLIFGSVAISIIDWRRHRIKREVV